MSNVKIPPGFCSGKPWLLIELDLELPDGSSEMAIIPQGMAVADQLHPFYWAEVETYTGMIAAGVTFADFFVIDKASGKPVRAGTIDKRFGAHEMAWLCCMFAERELGRVLWVQPDDISPEVIAAARKVKGADIREPRNAG